MLSGALLASEIVTKLSWDLASQYVTEFPSGSYPLVKLYPAGVVKTSGLSAPGNQFTACRIPGRGLCSVCKLFPPKHGNLQGKWSIIPESLSLSFPFSLRGEKKKKQIKILKRKFLKTRKVTFSPSSCGWTHVPSIINKEILNVQTKHMYLHSTESIFFPSYTPRSYQSLLINPDHLT